MEGGQRRNQGEPEGLRASDLTSFSYFDTVGKDRKEGGATWP